MTNNVDGLSEGIVLDFPNSQEGYAPAETGRSAAERRQRLTEFTTKLQAEGNEALLDEAWTADLVDFCAKDDLSLGIIKDRLGSVARRISWMPLRERVKNRRQELAKVLREVTASERQSQHEAAERGEDWRDHLAERGEGFSADARNVLSAFRCAPEWEGVIAFDEFSACTMVMKPLPIARQSSAHLSPQVPVPRVLSDPDITRTREWFEAEGFAGIGDDLIHRTTLVYAMENRFNSLTEYLARCAAELPDEVASTAVRPAIDPDQPAADTLSLWPIIGFGADDTPLNRAVARAFAIAMVRRARNPGCQQDYVLVIEGPQGLGKSRGLAALVGEDWLLENLPDLHDKDAMANLAGSWLCEIAELVSLRRSEVETMKAYVTRRQDKFRPAYGRNRITMKRTCSFAGTTNAATYLKDVTGNRRYWIVTSRAGVDVPWLAANRDRIWGLAAAAERAGEASWISDTGLQETLAAEQAERQEVDPWSETVEAWVEGGPGVVLHQEDTPRDADGRQVANSDGVLAEGIVSRAPRISEIDAARRITATEVLRCALGIRDGQQDQTKLNRVAALLIGLGWERRRARRDPNRPRNYWHPPRGDDEVPF